MTTGYYSYGVPKKTFIKNRRRAFLVGTVVGPIVVYAVFHKRIGLMINPRKLSLLAHTDTLQAILDNNYIPEFKTPVGVFKLVSPGVNILAK